MGVSKLSSMSEAIKDLVQDNSSLIIDGFTHLICFAAGHEIIRQRKKDLTLIRLTPDLVYDQMIEAGVAKKLVFSWAGNPGVGSLHALRRVSQKDSAIRIELEEYTHFGMVARFLAGAAGLPFWTLDNFKGTDLPKNNANIKSVICPYTGKDFATVPAINPDLAIIHCQRADQSGNAQVWGLMASQKEVAFSSKKVIIVAEEIVDSGDLRRDPNRTLIPGTIVERVVHEPWGCHPSYVQGYYDRDNDFYVAWDEISRDPESYRNWLDEFVYGCQSRNQYMKKMGDGLMAKLKARDEFCEGVNYGY